MSTVKNGGIDCFFEGMNGKPDVILPRQGSPMGDYGLVLLRHFGGNLSDCIRITVGSPSDNDQLLRVLGTLTESRDG